VAEELAKVGLLAAFVSFLPIKRNRGKKGPSNYHDPTLFFASFSSLMCVSPLLSPHSSSAIHPQTRHEEEKTRGRGRIFSTFVAFVRAKWLRKESFILEEWLKEEKRARNDDRKEKSI